MSPEIWQTTHLENTKETTSISFLLRTVNQAKIRLFSMKATFYVLNCGAALKLFTVQNSVFKCIDKIFSTVYYCKSVRKQNCINT